MTHLVDHPLAQDLLTTLRDQGTPSYGFRDALDRISALIVTAALHGLETHEVPVATPIGPAMGRRVTRIPTLVPVLRAGLGMLPAAQRLLPEAPVAFLGMSRNETTQQPQRYLAALPTEVAGGDALVLDPMIATGGSLLEVVEVLLSAGAQRIRVACVLAAPEGLQRLTAAHPDIDVWAASIDERLDHRAFIVPGLGDAGDRQFGVPASA